MFVNDTSFLKSIRDPLISVDSIHTILYINASGAAVFGKENENVITRKCYQAFQGNDSPCVICPIELVLVKHTPYITQKWMTLPDGSRRCDEITYHPYF